MKRTKAVKAWAVVDKDGAFCIGWAASDSLFAIFKNESEAAAYSEPRERVIPVLITPIEEDK